MKMIVKAFGLDNIPQTAKAPIEFKYKMALLSFFGTAEAACVAHRKHDEAYQLAGGHSSENHELQQQIATWESANHQAWWSALGELGYALSGENTWFSTTFEPDDEVFSFNERLALSVSELRNEHRCKLNTDFAYTVKFDRIHVLCQELYSDIVRDVFTRQGLEIASLSTYE